MDRDAGDSAFGGVPESAPGAAVERANRMAARHLTRRSVLAATGAGLIVGLGACAAPAQTPGGAPSAGEDVAPSATPELRSAPSRATYYPKLVVQLAEAADETRIKLADWRLRVGGLVAKPLDLTYDDLARFPRVAQTSALHCVEGWSVADLRWEGIRLGTLLDAVEPSATARWVTFDTFGGGYSDSLSLEQARLPDILLADRLADAPLPESLGFPLRLVVPRMYGYKSVKWLGRLTLAADRDLGFWEKNGYAPDAWLR